MTLHAAASHPHRRRAPAWRPGNLRSAKGVSRRTPDDCERSAPMRFVNQTRFKYRTQGAGLAISGCMDRPTSAAGLVSADRFDSPAAMTTLEHSRRYCAPAALRSGATLRDPRRRRPHPPSPLRAAATQSRQLGWLGWGRSFRSSPGRVAATSDSEETAGRSRLASNRRFASGRRPGRLRPREGSPSPASANR
jgi:hypothetical protein